MLFLRLGAFTDIGRFQRFLTFLLPSVEHESKNDWFISINAAFTKNNLQFVNTNTYL